MKTKKYIYNVHGVCTNGTNIFTARGKDKHQGISLELGFDGKYWDYGLDYWLGGNGTTNAGGHGSLPGKNPHHRLTDKNKVILRAIEYIRESIKRKQREITSGETVDKLLIEKFETWATNFINQETTSKTMGTEAITRYPGGKNASGVYQKIINQIPACEVFIEGCLGSGAIVRRIKPAHTIICIDKDQRVLNNLRFAKVENKFKGVPLLPGATFILDDICRYLKKLPVELNNRQTFIYIDPPYPMETRRSQRPIYKHEFTVEQHKELLALASTLKCNVMISSYQNKLYDSVLKKWRKLSFNAQTRAGKAVETLYMNYTEPQALHDYKYLGKDYRERERIKNKTNRWIKRLHKLPDLEKKALISAINTTFITDVNRSTS